jgi:hypothetical protein
MDIYLHSKILSDKRLSISEKIVWGALFTYALNGYERPSQTTVALATGISRATVNKAFKTIASLKISIKPIDYLWNELSGR